MFIFYFLFIFERFNLFLIKLLKVFVLKVFQQKKKKMSYSYIPQMNIADVDINIIHNDNDKYIIKKLPTKKWRERNV